TEAVALHHAVCNFGNVVWNFGNKNDVGSACDSGVHRNPARVSSHDFNDEDAAMTLSRRVEFIERITGGVDGRIETERNDGPVDIVVDWFRYTNERNALLVRLLGNGE